jgi:hypothetical protein
MGYLWGVCNEYDAIWYLSNFHTNDTIMDGQSPILRISLYLDLSNSADLSNLYYKCTLVLSY